MNQPDSVEGWCDEFPVQASSNDAVHLLIKVLFGGTNEYVNVEKPTYALSRTGQTYVDEEDGQMILDWSDPVSPIAKLPFQNLVKLSHLDLE